MVAGKDVERTLRGRLELRRRRDRERGVQVKATRCGIKHFQLKRKSSKQGGEKSGWERGHLRAC